MVVVMVMMVVVVVMVMMVAVVVVIAGGGGDVPAHGDDNNGGDDDGDTNLHSSPSTPSRCTSACLIGREAVTASLSTARPWLWAVARGATRPSPDPGGMGMW